MISCFKNVACKKGIFKLAMLVVAMAACSVFAADKLVIAVSVAPYANILQSIGGSEVEVVVMVPAGANPHTYEPRPDVLKRFAKAQYYFSDGSGMDKAWLPRFKGVNKNIQIVDISKSVSWMQEIDHHHAGKHEEHPEIDPHIWTSPRQASMVAFNMRFALSKIRPEKDSYFVMNHATFVRKLDNVEGQLKDAVREVPGKNRAFIVFHPSYGYLARDYGLTQYTVEVKGKEPKPKDLQKLIEEGKKHGVHLVFVQPQFSTRASETIAKELNAKVQTTDPLAYDFLSNTLTLVESIKDAALLLRDPNQKSFKNFQKQKSSNK